MNKKIVYISIIILLILITIIGFSKYNPLLKIDESESVTQVFDQLQDFGTTTNVSGTSNNSSDYQVNNSTNNLSIKEKAWSVLQKYLQFAKDKNVEGVKSLSYQISDSCKNYDKSDKNKKDCDNKMATVYFIGQELKKENFKYVWNDNKQIILLTDFKNEENDTTISKSRGIIYFIIDKGNIKILSFNHAKGAVIQKGEASKQELEDRLIRYTEDNDQDGKEDYLEECLSATQISGCMRTDTKNRDSDGDGFWDGIEVLFY